MASARSEQVEAITIPGAPASALGLASLYDDAAFKALFAAVQDARRSLPAWDNLAHVEAFATTAARAAELMSRYTAPQQRRALAHLLWQLLPVSSRARAHLPLPDDIARRADDGFGLVPGDMPRVASSWVSFLADPELLPKALARGPWVLVPRSQARAPHPRAPAALLQVERLEAGLVHGHGVDGNDGPARPTPLDVVAAWLLSAGPDARGLDLRSEDDRALLLTWAHLLRERGVDGRTAFAWLQDGNAPPAVKERVVDACLDAALTAVGTYTLDPVGCRFSLRAHERDGGWPEKAAACLRAVQLPDGPLVRDVVPRTAASREPAPFAAELLWADALLAPGFAAGRLSAVAAGRAFARLATSVLAPLGVLPLSGLKDGQGGVVLQRFVEVAPGEVLLQAPTLVSFGATVTREPLHEAWRAGRGLFLPDPRGGPRHDLAAMPAWLTLFLEGIDEGVASLLPQLSESGDLP